MEWERARKQEGTREELIQEHMEGTVKELVYGKTRGSNWEWTGKEPMKETVKEIGNWE